MLEKAVLLLVSVLFFAFLAKDITVPALVLAALASLRWLGTAEFSRMSLKETGR